MFASTVEMPTFFEKIIGKSPKMLALFNIIKKVSPTNATVLIQGESGTGKELIARAIHNLSHRRNEPFIAINCGVLSENLLENELFGHIKGAFTGATKYRKGLLQEADKGTLFLDEIADVPASVQTKLLRVLQEKEFKPLGSNQIVRVDVRIIAASNVLLRECVRQKRFREDLYYRLAVIPISVPPLRERAEDIPELTQHFIQKYNIENGKSVLGVSPNVMKILRDYSWPGNVRELENTLERAVVLSSGAEIQPEDLLGLKFSETDPDLQMTLKYNTSVAIQRALESTSGNRSKAAKMLGISRASLYSHLRKKCSLGIVNYSLTKDQGACDKIQAY